MDFNEELQKMSIDSLKELGTWVQGLKGFTLEQAPLFVREYANWYIYSHAVLALSSALVCVLGILVSTRYANYLFNRAENGEGSFATDDYQLLGSICRIGGLAVSAGFFFASIGDLQEVGKGVFAPRLVIIEGITQLVKDGTAEGLSK